MPFCTSGELRRALQDSLSRRTNVSVRLFKALHTPALEDTPESYVEADFGGYARLDRIDWGAPYLNNDDEAQADGLPLIWTWAGTTPAQSIFGYFVVDNYENVLWAEKRPGGPLLLRAGVTKYIVIPHFTLRNRPA